MNKVSFKEIWATFIFVLTRLNNYFQVQFQKNYINKERLCELGFVAANIVAKNIVIKHQVKGVTTN